MTAEVFSKISKDRIIARKEKDQIRSNLLTLVYSETMTIAKNEMREPNDKDLFAILKKMSKSLNESIKAADSRGDDTSDLLIELSITESYIPVQMSEDEIKDAIEKLHEDLGEPKNMKQMGVLMKKLKEEHEGKYDGKTASSVVKDFLSS